MILQVAKRIANIRFDPGQAAKQIANIRFGSGQVSLRQRDWLN